MNILLLVATERGRVFAQHVFDLLPNARFTVCSFRETSSEPPFTDKIQELTESRGHTFLCTNHPEALPDEFDLLFAVSWRYMVAKSFYERVKLGAYVFHDSLLPAYRGFAPTVWAMVNRESWHGATLLKMAEGVDEGEIVDQIGMQIHPDDYIGDVMPRITDLYLKMIDRSLDTLVKGDVVGTPQVLECGAVWGRSPVTYGCKRLPQDSRIHWSKSSAEIYALIRASSRPYTGAYCFHGSTQLTVWRAEPKDIQYIGYIPGRVVKVARGVGVDIVCGDGRVLTLTEMGKDNEVSTGDTYVRHITDTLS